MWQNGTKEILTFTANQRKGKIGKKSFFKEKKLGDANIRGQYN